MERPIHSSEPSSAEHTQLDEIVSRIKEEFGENAEFTYTIRQTGEKVTLTIAEAAVICGKYIAQKPFEELLPMLQEMYDSNQLFERITSATTGGIKAEAQRRVDAMRTRGQQILKKYVTNPSNGDSEADNKES